MGAARQPGAQAGGRAGESLTIVEVAELMQVSRMTVYRLVRSGALAADRVGRGLRVREAVLHAYLRTGGNPGQALSDLPGKPPRHLDA